jgi:hypothetical protein
VSVRLLPPYDKEYYDDLVPPSALKPVVRSFEGWPLFQTYPYLDAKIRPSGYKYSERLSRTQIKRGALEAG